MQFSPEPSHGFQFGVGSVLVPMFFCGIGFVAIPALFGPQPDESVLKETDKAIVADLRISGLDIRNEFT